ncbi:MAG: hypothetical protein NC085_09680 [Muribaculaceae bacterium]|nr:hypothetical protein [Muribaculaceae bacterium]MCM1479964.1 hypothetical protein [Muribaculaceae bacterium]
MNCNIFAKNFAYAAAAPTEPVFAFAHIMRCTADANRCANSLCERTDYMSCASCSNNNYTLNSVSNSDTAANTVANTAANTAANTVDCSCGSAAGETSRQCRLAVTVDNDYVPCTFTQEYFDVEVRSRDGVLAASGKVAGGSSVIFTLPCGGEYAVTVSGGICSSPRSQTRRVSCKCGAANGVSFIFMRLEQGCGNRPPRPCCCCPPMPRPPCPPVSNRPPRPPHFPCGDDGIDPHYLIPFAENDVDFDL